MKTSKREWTVSLLFCAVLLFVCSSSLLSSRSYSEREKRELAAAPIPDLRSVLSGRFADETEDYLSDHLPGRDLLVGTAAYGDLLAGRQNTKPILRGTSGRLYERPLRWNEGEASKNVEAIRAFADKTHLPTALMLVPSSGSILRDDLPALREPYTDEEMIARCYELAGPEIRCVDLWEPFSASRDRPGLYYATDHHWTSRGAHAAAETFFAGSGRSVRAAEDYAVTRVEGFYGSTYARSALWLTDPESVELWDCGLAFKVTNSESEEVHEGTFYPRNLNREDKYTVFLDGNHALVRIENPDVNAQGSLLLIRDSFSNCLGAFLAEGYRSVVLADLRYYRLPLSELCASEDFDEVLVAYSLGNFLSGSNLEWLD